MLEFMIMMQCTGFSVKKLEKSWNFVAFNKNRGKMLWNLEKNGWVSGTLGPACGEFGDPGCIQLM